MLKKLTRFLIVAVIQLTILVFTLFFLAPYVMDSVHSLANIKQTLENTRTLSLLLRVFVYVALFNAWPFIFKKIQNPSVDLLKQVNKARFILIGALLSIEALYWVGQL